MKITLASGSTVEADSAKCLEVAQSEIFALRDRLAASCVIPDLNESLRRILGRPNFQCGHIADVLRRSGQQIDRKSEAEQAAVLHWMLRLYSQHGEEWYAVGGLWLSETMHRLNQEEAAAKTIAAEKGNAP